MNLRHKTFMAFALSLICSTSLFAQIQGQNTFTRGAAEDSFAFDSPLNDAFGPLFNPHEPNVELATIDIEIETAVAAYAKLKGIDLQQARFDALEYFGATHGQLGRLTNEPIPKFKPLGADQYKVTASSNYLKSLPARIRSFELGKKSIVVTIDHLNLDDNLQQELSKFLLNESVEHIAGHLPAISPQLPEEKKGRYRAASTLQISKSMPLTIGQMTVDNYNRLIKLVRSRKNCDIVSSPTVVVHPGQDAIIQDGALKPFVIGLNQISGDFTHASQPLIQLLENGNFFKVNCDLVENQVVMRCSMSFAEIIGTDTLNLRNTDSPSALTVQTPSQQVRVIDISTELDSDRVLMLDPYHKTTDATAVDGNGQPRQQNVITLIRVKIVNDE